MSIRFSAKPAFVERCVTADPRTLPAVSGSEERPPHEGNEGSALSERTPAHAAAPAVNIWLLRVRALLFVTLCATFGVLLLILPWTPKWTDNPLLLSFPALREIVSSGFVRGLSTGLGVLDLWLGFWEAVHYHEGGLR